MNYEMRIILKSDLCSASGDGFSLTIDTDVCYDEFGFPIIPSRRLKGCMREAAEYIGAEDIEEIFGAAGSINGGELRVGNAVPEHYDSLKEYAGRNDKNQQQILSLFTSVRSMTAIENDTAKKESLRFMRTVNHYSPLDDKKEMVFVAPVEADEKYFTQLERICRATRNIGYRRSRGFGAVKCCLLKADSERETIVVGEAADEEKDYEIRYSIRTDSPVMLPGAIADETEDYISGTSVMGFFAARYLKTHDTDDKFEEIFLKNNVVFSNLYILSKENIAAVPASFAIAKDKTADKPLYVNSLVAEKGDRILKPLKGGYFADGSEVKVKTETIYHHSDREDGTLYTQTCIIANQCFGGTIRGKGKYLREIAKIFNEGKISVGRSKTAQYADCEILSAKITECVNKFESCGKGEKIAAIFCSDAIFIDENGTGCTEFSKICEKLGISGVDDKLSFMKYKTVTGYMSVGRYKKPHLRAVKAGSTICFSPDKTQKLPKIGYFGERTGEGFGQVCFVKAENIMDLNGGTFAAMEKEVVCDDLLGKLLEKNKELEVMRTKAIDYAKKNQGTLEKLTSSFVGRVLLMVRQAKDYDDLKERIDSVKTESKREEARKIVDTAEQYQDNKMQKEYLTIIFLLAKYFNRGKAE